MRTKKIRLRFTGPPGPDPATCGFIEVEDEDGASVGIGEWVIEDDHAFLEIEVPERLEDVTKEHGTGSEGYEASAERVLEETLETFEDGARRYGLTGFQASWVLLQALWRGNRWEGPGTIIKAADMLFPQYDHPVHQAAKFASSTGVEEWLREEAQKRIDEAVEKATEDLPPNTTRPFHATPAVMRHWKKLAGLSPDDPPHVPDDEELD